jgi:hypothetical protein
MKTAGRAAYRIYKTFQYTKARFMESNRLIQSHKSAIEFVDRCYGDRYVCNEYIARCGVRKFPAGRWSPQEAKLWLRESLVVISLASTPHSEVRATRERFQRKLRKLCRRQAFLQQMSL